MKINKSQRAIVHTHLHQVVYKNRFLQAFALIINYVKVILHATELVLVNFMAV